jgi:signal transduction histidine kinase
MLATDDPRLFKPGLYKTVLVPSVLLLIIVVILLSSLNHLRSSYGWVVHTNKVVSKIHVLERMIVDSETSLRGFHLTNDIKFLASYEDSLKQVPVQFKELNKLIHNKRPQLLLSKKIEMKYKNLVASWDRYKNYTSNKSKLEHMLILKRDMDDIRADIASFLSFEEKLLKNREVDARRTVFVTILLMLLLGGIAVLFLVLNTKKVFYETTKALQKFQNALERRTAELEATLNFAPIGFASFNRNLQYVAVNQALATINGRSIEFHYNKTLRDILPDASWGEAAIKHVFETGEVLIREISGATLSQPDLYRYWLSGFYPIRIQEYVEYVGLYVVEITDKIHTEEKLRKALKMRDEFLSVASHELKTPITSLLLQSQMLEKNFKKGLVPDLEKIKKYINLAIRQCQHLNRLIEDMLEISSIRSGRLSIQRKKVDLIHVVKEAINKLSSLFIEKNISIPSVNGPSSVEGSWDADRLEQVIHNLLANALKYGREKPIHVAVYPRGQSAVVEVSDEGVGIPEDRKSAIFEKFERAIDVSEVSGLGLGLFIANQIVLAHGGRLWVESVVGEGSTFFVELPVN